MGRLSFLMGVVFDWLEAVNFCGTPPDRQPFYIANVEVINALPGPTHTVLEPPIRLAVSKAWAKHPVEGAAKTMRLTLTDIHYKNAALSALLADMIWLTGTRRLWTKQPVATREA